MAGERIEIDSAGIRALLQSPEARAAVRVIAERAADRARGETRDKITTGIGGKSRARAYVTRLGSGAIGEAKDRALGRALSSGG